MMPKVSFGIIVLNGEPFTLYNLRSLYPYAHQIIVVEGATPGAKNIASKTGHSMDGTLETLYRFKKEEDSKNIVTIVTAEDEGYSDGFWPGEKDEQSQAYAKRATGDYLWQVDIDEFYRKEDFAKVFALLEKRPNITTVTFKMLTFWGSPNVITDSWFLRRGDGYFHRLFRWGPGYRYVTHRPPTVVDKNGQNMRSLTWISGRETERLGIRLYHYSLLFPKQVAEKCEYYQQTELFKRTRANQWARENYLQLMHLYRVHNVYAYPSWLEKYSGPSPEQIEQMWQDIQQGCVVISLRDMNDVQQLLRSRKYRIGARLLKILDYGDRMLKFPLRAVSKAYRVTGSLLTAKK